MSKYTCIGTDITPFFQSGSDSLQGYPDIKITNLGNFTLSKLSFTGNASLLYSIADSDIANYVAPISVVLTDNDVTQGTVPTWCNKVVAICVGGGSGGGSVGYNDRRNTSSSGGGGGSAAIVVSNVIDCTNVRTWNSEVGNPGNGGAQSNGDGTQPGGNTGGATKLTFPNIVILQSNGGNGGGGGYHGGGTSNAYQGAGGNGGNSSGSTPGYVSSWSRNGIVGNVGTYGNGGEGGGLDNANYKNYGPEISSTAGVNGGSNNGSTNGGDAGGYGSGGGGASQIDAGPTIASMRGGNGSKGYIILYYSF